jgi:putative flippase GtrA
LTAAAAGVAVGALALYGAAISWKTGDEFRRPPFLMARVLADGPGRAYLRASCAAGTPWVICRYKDLPLAKSDDLLWSALPETGVFNRSSYQDRVRMEKQETAFVLGTVAHDPGGQFAASMRNWGLQLGRFYVDDPLRRPLAFLSHEYWGKTNLVGLIRGVGPCGVKGELCEPKVKISQLALLDDAVVYVAIAALLLGLAQRASLGGLVRGRRLDVAEDAGRATAMALLLVAAVVLNAGVCGIFSGPFPRYQARIIWLVPAAAMLLALALVPGPAWRREWFGLGAPTGWPARSRTRWARVDPAFPRFGVVGATGFTVDGLILYALVHGAGLNYFVGRLISFTVAVGVTWLLNRTWTFKVRRTDGRLREAAVYFAVQCAGGAANIGVYTAAILIAPVLKDWLIVPLAMGSAVGLCLTYLGAKHLAFRHRQEAVLARPDGRAAEGASG